MMDVFTLLLLGVALFTASVAMPVVDTRESETPGDLQLDLQTERFVLDPWNRRRRSTHPGLGFQAPSPDGARLDRAYLKYVGQPITTAEATDAGWRRLTAATCDPKLGTPWTLHGRVSKKTPVTIYFSAAGQISGVGVDYWAMNRASRNLVRLGYIKTVEAGKRWSTTVALRNSNDLCNAAVKFAEPLGTQVVVHPDTIAEHVPLTAAAAKKSGYTRGSCFDGMGWHFFKDISVKSKLSWKAKNLMPVVPMYCPRHGTLNAIFFAAAATQPNAIWSQWEPVPLLNRDMCKNLCDSKCTFSGARAWSTMHFYFNNHKDSMLKCTASPEIRWCFTGLNCCAN